VHRSLLASDSFGDCGGTGLSAASRRERRVNNPLPRYHQIANAIRSDIDLREWSPGEQIPSETALAEAFGVSHVTVRQALALLVQEGRLRREQGRGTFVTEHHDGAERVRLTAPYQEFDTAMAAATVRLLDTQCVRGPGEVLKALGLTPGQQAVRIRRVPLNGKRAISYEVGYLPLSLGSDYTAQDLSDPLLIELIEKKAKVFFREANQTIQASLADPETAHLLCVPVGSPVLMGRRTYELDTGGIGYLLVSRYPSHLLRYEVRLMRQDSDRAKWAPMKQDWEFA